MKLKSSYQPPNHPCPGYEIEKEEPWQKRLPGTPEFSCLLPSDSCMLIFWPICIFLGFQPAFARTPEVTC